MANLINFISKIDSFPLTFNNISSIKSIGLVNFIFLFKNNSNTKIVTLLLINTQ